MRSNVKNTDWAIDLGSEGGHGGGNIRFTGTPEALVKIIRNYTESI
ncbi:MAG: hypothetical protein GY816_10345 [Cytophagales bacterium]|nr:hypothetical protein [Cytophagales bacterium]